MNPPSAIHGAMSRDRKPFTYTPGGLDLSEIKSERMAKRLMRNAMNQGVPELPSQPIQSPPMPSTPVIVPNFNCLPVQVFPAFNLPANPKSLLRTRSNPDQPKEQINARIAPPKQVDRCKSPVKETYQPSPKMPSSILINDNRPTSMYEYSSYPSNNYGPTTNYKNDGYMDPVLPEISYDAEYLCVSPKINQNGEARKLNNVITRETENSRTLENPVINHTPINAINEQPTKLIEDERRSTPQREVKVTKSVTNGENVEHQNGDKNGDIETELVVKLPTKKTGAKIETKVEVLKKILPDGTVEETKKTTTKTTVDGKTEIKTQTETRILPKEEADEEIEEIEEEEEEEHEEGVVQEVESKVEENNVEEKESSKTDEPIKENGQEDNLIKTEERSETTTTTTKKVVVVQSDAEEVEEIEEEEVQEEEIEDNEPVTTVIIKKSEKTATPPPTEPEAEVEEDEVEPEKSNSNVEEDKQVESVETEEQEEQDEEEVIDDENEGPSKEEKVIETKVEDDEEVEEEEEYEEAEEHDEKTEAKVETETVMEEKVVEEEVVTEKQVAEETLTKAEPQEKTIPVEIEEKSETKVEEKIEVQDEKEEQIPIIETKVPLNEPTVPLEKIEDVEIKPIGPAGVVTKTHTEKTEIITSSSDQPSGVHSTQTEYNRIENIVTVNRTTKTLDNNPYESVIQPEIPPVKSYFTPSRILASPMPSSPYQPVYPPSSTERRHSLLLERLSVDRQMPSEIYHNQTYEQQRQVSQEPQSEVLTISNVKPSKITNQQWYQQRETTFNNTTSTPMQSETPSWAHQQPKSQPQTTYKPQPTYTPAQSYQPPPAVQPQPTYQAPQSYQPTPTYQTQHSLPTQQTYQNTTPQPVYTPQPAQNQYQPSYTEPIQNNNYSYTPKPLNRVTSVDTTPSVNTPSNFYTLNKDSTETYQKSTQQYSSSYVPPPWEQDSSYVPDYNQNYYQPPPTNTFNTTPTTPTQSWKPAPPKNKFSKPPPTAFIPPAPNQSFVKPVVNEPSKQSGRKTYYSEYERRYISVPESTYIPQETKYQPQPDPSPKYYYDNNESNETVEHEWRKELREFTEKTSQTPIDQATVKPPWESEPKYVKNTNTTYTPTPTWSQTVRPRSWRERSFESEFVGSQEWPKTNTLGRGRPLTSYSKNEPIVERTRGVSVDRYNPNSYQAPSSLEHPPVQTHTLNAPAPHGTYHNPNVPAYHSRSSAEPRDQPVSYKQPRAWRDQRVTPLQSRSFKYLQWITGTDD